jgi:Polyketide cyclase / dehydrase and lipid transport
MYIRFIRQLINAANLRFAPLAGIMAVLGLASAISKASAEGSKQLQASSPYLIAITRSIVIPRPPHVVFSFISAEDVLPKVLTGYGPLPAVVRTSENTGPWNRPGSARIVHLADGNTAREMVTIYNAPNQFAYRVWNVSHPVVRSLSDGARGEWTFAAHPSGTLVTWTYTFSAVNAAAYLPLKLTMNVFWRGYMDVCLENTKSILRARFEKG